jgi:plasmid stabilization system protein ParE
MTYRLLAPALDDLDHIDAWVASRFGETVASKVSENLFDLFDLLAANQQMGLVRRDITDAPVRFFSQGPNWIIYEPGDPLLIHRIYPAAKDLQQFTL